MPTVIALKGAAIRTRLTAAAALVVVTATAAILPPPSEATPPTRNAAHHNGNIAYAEGSNVRLITPSGAPLAMLPDCSIRGCNDAGDLAWSPGGRKLAFVRGVVHGGGPGQDKFGLFVSNASGAHLRRLMGCGDCLGSSISWSPGGSTIAVTDGYRLALVKVKTRTHRLVARCAERSGDRPWSPAWSPEGSKVAFACGASLYLITRTGRHAHVISRVPGQVQLDHLSWSPDGKTLAFDSADSIYTVGADGSHLKTLLAGQAGSGPGVPSWSPDGTRIVYFNTPGVPNHFYAEVWVMNADGTQNHRLYRSGSPVGDWVAPVWSPDGKRIAFSPGYPSGGLMIMDADGSRLHEIAPDAHALAWQPLP